MAATEGQAFGVDQDGGPPPRASSPASSFIASPPPAIHTDGILEAGNHLATQVGKWNQDKEEMALGQYIADGRSAMREVTNPVMQAQLAERLTQGALRKFGAKHATTIDNGFKNPDNKRTYDATTGEEVIQQWDGSITRRKLQQPTADTEVESYMINQAGIMAGVAPNLSRVADSIMSSMTDKDGKPAAVNAHGEATDLHLVTDATNAHFNTMSSLGQNMAVIKYNNPFFDDKVTNQALMKIENSFANVADSFMSDRIANMVKDDNRPGITPESVIRMYDAFVIDHDKAFSQFASSFNMTPEDVKRETDMKKAYRDKLYNAYTAAAKGGLEQFKRQTEMWTETEKMFKSKWFMGLDAPNKELIMRAPTLNAMSTALLNHQMFISNFGHATANEQKMIASSLGFMAPIFQFNTAETHMSLIRSTKLSDTAEAPERAYNFVNSINSVLSNTMLGPMYYDEIKAKAEGMKGAFDSLVEKKKLQQSTVDNFYAEIKRYGEAYGRASQQAGSTPENTKAAWDTIRNMLGTMFQSQPSNPIPRK